MKIDNPYSEALALMEKRGAKNNPPSICIGTIVAPPPNIVLTLGKLQIDKDNIFIADYLLSGYQREISIEQAAATGSACQGSVSSVGIPDTKMSYKDTLKAGDSVAVLATADRQKYIVFCKVVNMNNGG